MNRPSITLSRSSSSRRISPAALGTIVLEEKIGVIHCTVSPDGNQIASGSWNGEVKVWNLADGKVLKEFNASPGLQAAAAPAKK